MFHASTNADFTLLVRPEFRAGLSFTQEIQAHAISVWTVAAETITGKRIAGNSRKFTGLPVDLHGVVVNVVDDRTFNFRTGDVSMDDNGNISNTMGMIVVRRNSTQDLEADQHLRVLGIVAEPVEGTNAMGGAMTFPTVEAKYME